MLYLFQGPIPNHTGGRDSSGRHFKLHVDDMGTGYPETKLSALFSLESIVFPFFGHELGLE